MHRDGAIEISEKALKFNDNDPFLFDNLGYYYMENSNYDKAIEKFKICLKIENFKGLIDATLGLALAYYYKNDKQNAKKYFDQAKQVKPLLNKGMEGLLELEKEGYSYSEKKKETLKKNCLRKYIRKLILSAPNKPLKIMLLLQGLLVYSLKAMHWF